MMAIQPKRFFIFNQSHTGLFFALILLNMMASCRKEINSLPVKSIERPTLNNTQNIPEGIIDMLKMNVLSDEISLYPCNCAIEVVDINFDNGNCLDGLTDQFVGFTSNGNNTFCAGSSCKMVNGVYKNYQFNTCLNPIE